MRLLLSSWITRVRAREQSALLYSCYCSLRPSGMRPHRMHVPRQAQDFHCLTTARTAQEKATRLPEGPPQPCLSVPISSALTLDWIKPRGCYQLPRTPTSGSGVPLDSPAAVAWLSRGHDDASHDYPATRVRYGAAFKNANLPLRPSRVWSRKQTSVSPQHAYLQVMEPADSQ